MIRASETNFTREYENWYRFHWFLGPSSKPV